MKKPLIVGIAAAVALSIAVPANGAGLGHFGRLFPNAPGFTDPTPQQVADLAQSMLDPNLDENNNCPVGTPSPANGPECTASGFTYFGQFIDHDLTLDTLPQPTGQVDPTTLINNRTLAFDLDSVYGAGPTVAPQFYAADGKHFLLPLSPTGVVDLPRNADGSAIINEARNDENQIISQIEIAMMSVHNKFVDQGKSFDQARRLTTLYYQWAVLHDFMPHTLYPGMDENTLRSTAAFLRTLIATPDTTMIEFSVAAYRFGHSQVRKAYEVNDTSGKVQVFSLTAPDLRGGQPLTPARKVDWGNFFHELTDANDVVHMNVGRRIDPLISSGLFALPIPGAEATGSNVLAFRNMTRAIFYNMPSGQTIAQRMGFPVITPAELNLGPGFENGTPLWYYVLAEAQRVAQGRTLGPLGSAIVGATFYSALLRDPNSILRNNILFRPDKSIAGTDGVLTLSDLFAFAGTSA